MDDHEILIKKFYKLFVLILVSFCFFLLALFHGGFVSWFLFYSFFPFAFYGVTLCFYTLNEMKISRNLVKKSYFAGDKLTVVIQIERKSSFPLFYLAIEDLFYLTVFANLPRKTKFILFPGFKKEFSFTYTIDQLPRGDLMFADIHVKTGDLLGIVEKEKNFPADQNIVIFPVYSTISNILQSEKFALGNGAARRVIQPDPFTTGGVRKYQPGDRLSWINWKASAKRNEMITKEFEQRKSKEVMVVMDCAANEHFEETVTFTASIMVTLIQKGIQAYLQFNNEEAVLSPIRDKEKHLRQILTLLAKIKPCQNASFERDFNKKLTLTASVFLVTAKLTMPLIEMVSKTNAYKETVNIFFIKGKNATLSREERMLKSVADSRGVKLVIFQGFETIKRSGAKI